MPRHGFVGTGSLAASRAYAWAWPVGDDVCLPLPFTCVCVCWLWHQHEYHLQHKHFSTGRQIGCQQSNTCLSFSVGVSSAVESEAVANPTGRPPQAIFSLSSGAFKWNWISNAEKATETRRSTWATVAGVASSCLLPLPAAVASPEDILAWLLPRLLLPDGFPQTAVWLWKRNNCLRGDGDTCRTLPRSRLLRIFYLKPAPKSRQQKLRGCWFMPRRRTVRERRDSPPSPPSILVSCWPALAYFAFDLWAIFIKLTLFPETGSTPAPPLID